MRFHKCFSYKNITEQRIYVWYEMKMFPEKYIIGKEIEIDVSGLF